MPLSDSVGFVSGWPSSIVSSLDAFDPTDCEAAASNVRFPFNGSDEYAGDSKL